ncbi:MAG: lytic murein transglycosylase B [Methylococcaceae bacterium]|nr:lytic murein transglycosylase B [Methylococcaceae bacterium]
MNLISLIATIQYFKTFCIGILGAYAFRFFVCVLSIQLTGCTGNLNNTESVDAFIEHMASSHQFDKEKLYVLFDSVDIKDDILKKISAPAESLPWYKYRKIFLTEARINNGVKFWRQNEQVLSAIQQQYGVPAEIIVAIIGVETSYGQNTGKYRIIDALSTLAFAYPPRSKFFLGELGKYLLVCRDENRDPLEPTGSYAGAMGVPQFMPSSFISYAVDFDKDGRKDIWHDNKDVIASIGNYFSQHGWQKDREIAFSLAENEKDYGILFDDLKPDLRIDKLQSIISKISGSVPLNTKVKLLGLKQEHGEELWATLDNFYVITRYNHSPLYAMAVFQLSQAISNKKQSASYE